MYKVPHAEIAATFAALRQYQAHEDPTRRDQATEAWIRALDLIYRTTIELDSSAGGYLVCRVEDPRSLVIRHHTLPREKMRDRRGDRWQPRLNSVARPVLPNLRNFAGFTVVARTACFAGGPNREPPLYCLEPLEWQAYRGTFTELEGDRTPLLALNQTYSRMIRFVKADDLKDEAQAGRCRILSPMALLRYVKYHSGS